MNDLRLALLVIGALILAAIYFYGRWDARRKGSLDQEIQHGGGPAPDILDEPLEVPEAQEGQQSEVSAIESQPVSSSRMPAEHPARKAEEKELLDDLDDLTSLIEEAKEHLPEKNIKHSEVTPMEEEKKSRFSLPKRWIKTKIRAESAPAPRPEESIGPELILVLTVVAHGKGLFRGKDIVRFLEGQGLCHGEMDIFHAYSAGGRSVFSVANIVEPGIFDLRTIDSFVTPGLTLFLRLPGPAGGFAAFDAMLETARILAEGLNGEIRDERRNVLTTQAVQQIRERILAFNRACRSVGV